MTPLVRQREATTHVRNEEGFTLIELLLYVSLSAGILLVVSGFIFFMLQARVKHQTMTEVNEQGRQAMELIAQSVRNAESINSPSKGGTGVSLSLDVDDPIEDPLIFDSSGGALRIQRGASPILPITNSNVVVSNLTFQNVSKGQTPGTVRIEFTITYDNPSNRNEFAHTQTFAGTASLR